MTTKEKSASVGRPRGFDIDQALEQALEVFWRNGYEGASLADLTKAMDINKPSLYSAFGNKQQLFLKAIDLYESRPDSFFHQASHETTLHGYVRAVLFGAAECMTDTDQPKGCALMKSTLSCSETSDDIKNALLARCADKQHEILERMQKARQDGELPKSSSPEALANFLIVVLDGMSVRATNDVGTEELRQVAQLALQCFPASEK